jgi:hypothetical protein
VDDEEICSIDRVESGLDPVFLEHGFRCGARFTLYGSVLVVGALYNY